MANALGDDNLLLDILNHLKLADLVNTLRVSRRWRHLSHSLISELCDLLSPLFDNKVRKRSAVLHAFRVEFRKGQLIKSGAFNNICTALAKGAMAQCQILNLSYNQIGDPGLASLADVCAKGGLPRCEWLDLSANNIGDIGLASFADACARGALTQCQKLFLSGNKIGDRGLESFADACAMRALMQLQVSWRPTAFSACFEPW